MTTTTTDIKRVKASDLKAGDLIGTTGSNSRATVEAGASDRGATGRSRGNGASVIAAITAGPGGRIQARDAAGKMIRSMAPETVVWRSREVDGADAPAAEAADEKPAKTTGKAADKPAKSKPAAAKPASFEWPKPPAKLLAEYLKARVTDEVDGPNRKQPFIMGQTLRVHSTDWIAWLAEQGIAASKAEAAKPLRDAGLGVRSFPIPGEKFAYGFYTGPAPAGTDRLPRRASARRAAGPRNPFRGLTEAQRSYLVTAMVERPDEADEMRDELLQLLIAAAPAA